MAELTLRIGSKIPKNKQDELLKSDLFSVILQLIVTKDELVKLCNDIKDLMINILETRELDEIEKNIMFNGDDPK